LADGAIRHSNTAAWGPAEAEAEHVASGGTDGDVMTRDESAVEGWSWQTPAGGGFLHQATVTLTNDQIKAMPGGAVTEGVTQIIAAPGANKIIVPLTVLTISDFAGGAYTNIAADAQMVFVLGASIADYVDVTLTMRDAGSNDPVVGLLGSTERKFAIWSGKFTIDTSLPDLTLGSLATVTDQPLQLYVYNATEDFTDGHADNSLLVTVSYYVLNLTTGEFE
jgi:hypothetical protein